MSDLGKMTEESPAPSPTRHAHPLVIGIAGPCGAGKTTLAAAFEKLSDVGVVGEPIFPDLSETLSIPRSDTGALLQDRILRGRAEAAASVKDAIIVLDRSVAEDREVFFPLHRHLGSLSEHDEQRLSGVAEAMELAIGVPVAMVILTASIDTLQRRARDDGRPEWLVESLPLQLELYHRWLRAIEVPFVIVNTDHIGSEAFPAVAEWIVASALQAIAAGDAILPELGLKWERPSV